MEKLNWMERVGAANTVDKLTADWAENVEWSATIDEDLQARGGRSLTGKDETGDPATIDIIRSKATLF